MQVGRWNHQSGNNLREVLEVAAAAHIRRARQRDAAGLQVVIRLAEEAAAMGHEAASAVIVAGVAVAHAAAASGVFGETEAEISKFMNKTVVTTSEPVFVAEHKFSDFDINPHLKKNIEARKYENPTPIQDKAIPHALLGQDVVGLTATGTGKTAAFLIPLIDKVMKQKGERVLIMAPTRELAVQIEKSLPDLRADSAFAVWSRWVVRILAPDFPTQTRPCICYRHPRAPQRLARAPRARAH